MYNPVRLLCYCFKYIQIISRSPKWVMQFVWNIIVVKKSEAPL